MLSSSTGPSAAGSASEATTLDSSIKSSSSSSGDSDEVWVNHFGATFTPPSASSSSVVGDNAHSEQPQITATPVVNAIEATRPPVIQVVQTESSTVLVQVSKSVKSEAKSSPESLSSAGKVKVFATQIKNPFTDSKKDNPVSTDKSSLGSSEKTTDVTTKKVETKDEVNEELAAGASPTHSKRSDPIRSSVETVDPPPKSSSSKKGEIKSEEPVTKSEAQPGKISTGWSNKNDFSAFGNMCLSL